uniref:CUB domain-containing protein n=1 Tax=Graphocephala atropunctata TaxID=36148 RepID=A0A1B6M9B4_9HEMI
MTCTSPLFLAFFFLLCIPYLGSSKYTAVAPFIFKRQVSEDDYDVEDPNDPCWKFSHGYPREMAFYSPMYPDNYPSRIECFKVIEAPEGKQIRLDFRDQFFLESDPNCKFDFLEVRDGQRGYSSEIGTFCGNNFPDMITSSDRFLWLRFRTDDSIEYSGFKAVYTFIDTPVQNPVKKEPCIFNKEGPEGWVNKTDISNETFAFYQAHNEKIDCMFIIRVKPGWQLQLQFIQYKMDKPNECDSNYIEVFPNVTLVPKRVSQYCGSIATTTKVESNVSHIRFVAEPKAFNSTFAILWTAFRAIKKEEQCADDEFDCEDFTCIPKELKCNENFNCRYKNDEDKDEVCIANTSALGKLFAETHMIAIVALFFIILTGMCSTFIFNCTKKLIRDHRIIKQQMAASRASRLDQVGKGSAVQLSTVLPASHSHSRSHSHSHSTDSSQSHSVSQRAECYVPDAELMPILMHDDMHFPEMRDSECQTRESLFHTASFTPNSSGGESFTPPPPPPPPTSRPPKSTPRSTASPGFTTFGKSRQKTSAEPRFRAEAVIELSKRADSNKTSERPFSVQSTKSAPDVIVTH